MTSDNSFLSFDQIPYLPEDFLENPEPRCPCVLLLDVSGSMAGEPLREMQTGLEQLQRDLCQNTLTMKRVELAIVTFGSTVSRLIHFQSPDNIQMPRLQADGATPMGAAVKDAIMMIDERKELYKANGIAYYRPWIFLVTDGAPTDDISEAMSLIREREGNKGVVFFAVGVEDADMSFLRRLSVREPQKLKGLQFTELFKWLSASLSRVSESRPGDALALPAPTGWTSID